MRRLFPRTLGVGALVVAIAGGGLLLSRAYIGHSWTMADEIKQKEVSPEQGIVPAAKSVDQARNASSGVDVALLAMSSMNSEEGKGIKPISTTCIVNSPQADSGNGLLGSGGLQAGLINGASGGSRDIMGGSAEIRPIYEGNLALNGGAVSVGR